ncbi:MAG: chemotaxis protein CheX [Syntrophobacteraceae bacterium]
MNPQWRQAMKTAISEVLETMFFAMVDFEGEGAPDGGCPWYCEASIEAAFDAGKVAFFFRLSEDFARMATAGFLGSREEQVNAEEIEDAMKELANMVGGNFLSRVEEKNVRLGIPAFRMAPAHEGVTGADAEMLNLYCLGDRVGAAFLERR